jgi:hypothetical protein
MTDDERAIRDLVATWMKASEAGDLNTVLSLMADDVIFMAPGREPFGKEEFRAASETMKKVRLAGKSDIRELKGSAIGPIFATTSRYRSCRPTARRCSEVDTRSRSFASSLTENGSFGGTRI